MRITAKDSVCLIVDYQEKILPAISLQTYAIFEVRETDRKQCKTFTGTSDLRDPDGHDGSVQQGAWSEYPANL